MKVRHILRDCKALAATEFALTAPVLVALFIGSIDAAQMLVTQLKLAAAVNAGASYVLMNVSNVNSASGANLASAIATIVGNVNGNGWASGTVVVNNGPTATFANGTSTSTGTASNADSSYCMTGSPGSWSWGAAQTSGASCGTNVATAGKFVTITASTTFTPLVLGVGFSSGSLTSNIAVQVQ